MAYYVDPFPMDPPLSKDPPNFDPRADSAWKHMGEKIIPQLNALPPILAAAAGTAVIPFKFKTATSGDPGSGGLLLNNASQRDATACNLDLLDALGNDETGRLARMGAGTSTVKGELVLTKVGDGRSWLSFEVTSGTSPGGYRALVLQNGAGSSASPFAADDDVVATYVPTGQKGDTGPQLDVAPDFLAYEVSTAPTVVVGGRATRQYNTVERNRFSWTFSSFQLTLPAGDYMVMGSAPSQGVGETYTVLRNVTDSSDLVKGPSALAATVGEYQFFCQAILPPTAFTLSGTKTVRVEHFSTSDGLYGAASTGNKNAYLAIWKRN